VSEPPQTAEKTFTEDDKLARTPAVAVGYHLPPRMTREFFALSLLDPLLVGDESARWFQKLVKETQLATSLVGGFNLLGNNFDMKGPMLYTVRVDYKPDRTAREVLAAMDEVLASIQTSGVTADDLSRARTAFESAFFEEMEGGVVPGFGKANLLAAFTLFDNDPNRINTILAELERVTPADVRAAAARWLVPANRTSIDRRPVPAGGAR
jgi:predicted Zn-dependent peptidase